MVGRKCGEVGGCDIENGFTAAAASVIHFFNRAGISDKHAAREFGVGIEL